MGMYRKPRFFFDDLLQDESGQAITEYGAMIAFVCVLVALIFAMSQGALAPGINACYSTMAAQLQNLINSANGP
jgi:Flp pilus assembly pilin Flp